MQEKHFYDKELEGTVYFYKISNRADLGEFIKNSDETMPIDKIPMKKWFVYYANDSGDNTSHYFMSLEDYKSEKESMLFNTTEILKAISEL